MIRLYKFAFSKKLDKIIQKEAERERIRTMIGKNNGVFEEGRKTYYYREGKVQEVDDDVRDQLKSSETVDKFIQNDDLKKMVPIILLSTGKKLYIVVIATFLSITLRNKVLVKDDVNKKFTDKEYEINRLQAVQEQADFEQKQKDEELRKFRESENQDMVKDTKSKGFK